MKVNRRNFLLGTAAAAAQAGVAAALPNAAQAPSDSMAAKRRPNIVIYHSDQFRWDFVGANGLNSSTRTPNLDALAAAGTNFTHAVTNQPVCGPSRSVMLTGRYASETGVWRNGLGLKQDLPTLATELRKAGYTANYIGKWHLAAGSAAEGGGRGPVIAEHRGGFLDLWEGSNALEFSTHPYQGAIWDRDNNPIDYKDEYRVDFLTDRAEKFLRQKQEKPFLLLISQLEPHQQNDLNRMVGPKGSAERFINAYVPPDLRAFPGDWHQQLPDYYGACESIDASVGRLRKVLEEEGLADNTIFVFMSDHGCHFMTRNQEYKRSTHNSSLRVPMLIHGPGFESARQIQEIVGIVDLAPTLLDAAGVPVPESMKGHSFRPLVHDAEARQAWPNQQLIQISESMTGRSIRTKDWTYCVADPTGATGASASTNYHEYQLYDQRNDPYELVNLAGRKEYRQTAEELREELKRLIVASGEPAPDIVPAKLYP
ncbi:MAG: sulfatase-like hydrolase/transferase [Acidobacteriaceae bacterium]|nr:sulfatase-like hydrolase/transferase [Acidobacteriaceae bacterium]